MIEASKKRMREMRRCLLAEEANLFISDLIRSQKPFMVSRFGNVELNSVIHYVENVKGRRRLLSGTDNDYRLSKNSWPETFLSQLHINAGFFPSSPKYVEKFCELMLECMPQVDLLGSWVKGEGLFDDRLLSSKICRLADIVPFSFKTPWTQYLEGKNVLVIHPFVESIRSQYYNYRTKLFSNSKILPDFNLITLKAVQSQAGNTPDEFKDWFCALDFLFDNAMHVDADVVLLGCGAYGFPLSAKLKKAGRQVIHLGGGTQILFGIKGKRWDTHPSISLLYNQHWVRPQETEKPLGFDKVEGGCYW